MVFTSQKFINPTQNLTSSCLSSERLQREKEIAEERAERRLEILKNLVNNNGTETATMNSAEDGTKV